MLDFLRPLIDLYGAAGTAVLVLILLVLALVIVWLLCGPDRTER